MNLTVILADAELEPVPEGRDGRGLPMLDAYFHVDLVGTMEDRERRGRGDIVHNSLQLLQSSDLNRRGRLRVLVHTRQDKVVAVDPRTDIAPNYVQFLGQMAALLRGGRVGGYAVSDRDLRKLVREQSADLVVAMSPHGRDVPLKEILGSKPGGTVAVIVGAFPAGDYRSPVYELSDTSVSLGPELLTVPDVLRKVLAAVPE